MNVTVILPTYQRPESLPWALASVLLQRTTHRRRAVVINNGGDERAVDSAVEAAVAAVGENEWELRIVHRRPAMDPVTSWYAGIFENADDGDCVLLHGDDDLLTPGGVEVRTQALAATGADLLLTRSAGDLFFDAETPGSVLVGAGARLPPGPAAEARGISIGEAIAWDPGFIGNHAYRMGAAFRLAYEAAAAAARALPLEERTALTAVPFLLPVWVAAERTLAGSDAVACIRGQSLQAVTRARFGHTNWTPGIIYAASQRLLGLPGLRDQADLEPWRAVVARDLATWYVPTLAFPRSRAQLESLGFGGLLPHLRVHPGAVLHGTRLVLLSLLRLQGTRLKWDWLASRSGYRRVDSRRLLDDMFCQGATAA